MTEHDDDTRWPPTPFGEQMQQAGKQAGEQQAEFFRRMMGGGTSGMSDFFQLSAMSQSMATFKTRVQKGGRISIPDTEREALGIDEGDIVQTVIIPIKHSGDSQ